MENESTFNIAAADGFPFSRDSQDFKQGLALMRKVLGADDAAGAHPVLDHDGLPESRLQFLADQPCGDVGAVAGRARHDQRHLPLRPRTGLRRQQAKAQQGTGERRDEPAHAYLPNLPRAE